MDTSENHISAVEMSILRPNITATKFDWLVEIITQGDRPWTACNEYKPRASAAAAVLDYREVTSAAMAAGLREFLAVQTPQSAYVFFPHS